MLIELWPKEAYFSTSMLLKPLNSQVLTIKMKNNAGIMQRDQSYEERNTIQPYEKFMNETSYHST